MPRPSPRLRLRAPGTRLRAGAREWRGGAYQTGSEESPITRRIDARLRALESPESPFVDARHIPRGTHWTLPELVAQIGFAEWTSDGRLRQARFLGMRDDKPPAEVVRERAVENP